MSRILTLSVVCLMLGTAVAAFADQPSWLGGYWDDGDLDGTIASVLRAEAVPSSSNADVRPLWVPVAPLERFCPGGLSASPLALVGPRAPPSL